MKIIDTTTSKPQGKWTNMVWWEWSCNSFRKHTEPTLRITDCGLPEFLRYSSWLRDMSLRKISNNASSPYESRYRRNGLSKKEMLPDWGPLRHANNIETWGNLWIATTCEFPEEHHWVWKSWYSERLKRQYVCTKMHFYEPLRKNSGVKNFFLFFFYFFVQDSVVGWPLTILTHKNIRLKSAMLYYTRSILICCVIHFTWIVCIMTILLCV